MNCHVDHFRAEEHRRAYLNYARAYYYDASGLGAADGWHCLPEDQARWACASALASLHAAATGRIVSSSDVIAECGL